MNDMKIDEKVPVKIPITKTNAKSLIIPAPKIQRDKAAKSVVILVKMDLDNTRLIAMIIIFLKFVTGFTSNSSRILSKTTMVSLIEYPTIIRIEASMGAVNCPEHRMPSEIEPMRTNKPTVIRTSCIVATTAPIAYPISNLMVT